MDKRKILINKCYSSSVNYIHDIRMLGYEPVLLEPYVEDDELRTLIQEDYAQAYALNGDVIPEILTEKKSYEETLAMIRRLSPVLILPGCDRGLWLSLRVSHDLGLKNNSFSIYRQIRDKFYMQKVIGDAGLLTIPTQALSSKEQAVSLFHLWGANPVVLKPTQSSASWGVRICRTKKELCQSFEELYPLVKERAVPGEQLIIQKYIKGTEYAVDTISCEGNHVALYGWKYEKKVLPGYGTIYDRELYISPDEEKYDEMIEYVFQVLTALGIQFGAVHTEVILTKEGPVLVEVNARPGGGSQKYTFQDQVMQEHETLISLMSYLLPPEEFLRRYPRRMHLKQHAASKDICLSQNIYVIKPMLEEACRDLPTFSYALSHGENCLYPMTTDLSTSGGTIYLTGKDEKQLEKDLNYIKFLEENAVEQLYLIKEENHA